VNSNQVVLHLPMDVTADIILPPIDVAIAKKLLSVQTMSNAEACELAQNASCSLEVFQRATSNKPIRPEWAAFANDCAIRRAFFAERLLPAMVGGDPLLEFSNDV